MPKITNAIQNIRNFDDLASMDSFIHRTNPIIKLLTTIVYLIVVASYNKYEIAPLFVLLIYPVIIFNLSDIPLFPIFKRLIIIEPFIILIGILNPFLDTKTILIGNLLLSKGWLTFFSLIIKSGLTVTAALLLVATTGMDNIAVALRKLKVPSILVLQLLLTYRYITVLLDEVHNVLIAYSLRAPLHKGVKIKAWGSLAGQILLRTFDRATKIYIAMCLRGFNGEYKAKDNSKIKKNDIVYLLVFCILFLLFRIFDITLLLGKIFVLLI